MFQLMNYKSPIGDLLLIADSCGKKLLELRLPAENKYVKKDAEFVSSPADGSALARAAMWLDLYFSGQKPEINEIRDILAPQGTDFRKSVWEILCEIPYGNVITYGDIAARIAAQRGIEKMSARACGGAVGHNPIAIIIPCHRVIGAGGNLTGFGGGIQAKISLLELEGVDMSEMYVPKKGTKL